MDVMTLGLIGQLLALAGLVLLFVLGPPAPHRVLRLREDGRTEQVDEDSGEMWWRFLARLMVALFACSTLIGITGVARG